MTDMTFHGRGVCLIHPCAGGLHLVAALRYTSSPVGPYGELLHARLPGRGGLLPSVTRMLVDSQASRRSGRAYWGFPKELARFEWEERAVRVTQGAHLVAEFAWEAPGAAWPVPAWLLPRPLRTARQWHDRARYLTPLGGHGLVRPARLRQALVNPQLFADLGRPPLALELAHFELRLPPARIGRAGGSR